MNKIEKSHALSERRKTMGDNKNTNLKKEPFKLQLGEDVITVAFLAEQKKSFRLPDGTFLVETGERKAYFIINDKYTLGEVKQGSPWKAQAAALWATRLSALPKKKKELSQQKK